VHAAGAGLKGEISGTSGMMLVPIGKSVIPKQVVQRLIDTSLD
jgi:hypothetical protein